MLASEAHKFAQHQPVSITVAIRSAKNDAAAEGNRFCFDSSPIAESGCAFDFATDMWDWSVRAKPLPDQPFFSCGKYTLSASALNKSIKKTAMALGLPSKRMSTHSLRIGGASALAASGVPDYIIQKMGRWKSLAFLTYIRLANEAYAKALKAIATESTLTIEHVRQCVPNA